jgi:hypothetical protein
MFDHTSRYYHLETVIFETADGRTVSYVRRRFLPQGERLPLLVEATVRDGERLDLLTHRTLGEPTQFWRIADANNAMNPFDLTAEPGETLRVPVPQVEA